MASFFSTASAMRAIQSTTPEPATRPTTEAETERRLSIAKRALCWPWSEGTRAESTTPSTASPTVKPSGMIMWSRSMKVPAISEPRNTQPHTAAAGGRRSQQARKSAAVRSSTKG